MDFAVHSPDKEDVGISNPHFHVMCPIRPLDEHGRWGNKQRREYVLDEHGERIRDEAGNYEVQHEQERQQTQLHSRKTEIEL